MHSPYPEDHTQVDELEHENDPSVMTSQVHPFALSKDVSQMKELVPKVNGLDLNAPKMDLKAPKIPSFGLRRPKIEKEPLPDSF